MRLTKILDIIEEVRTQTENNKMHSEINGGSGQFHYAQLIILDTIRLRLESLNETSKDTQE